MSDLISRKALLEAHQDLVAFGTDTTFAVRNLITNAPAIEQGEPVPQPQTVKDALEKAIQIIIASEDLSYESEQYIVNKIHTLIEKE